MADNASSAPPKGRAKACTACRQVKLKCDAREVYPKPCTRCRQQSLDCKMDPTFKRVPARRQLEEVSNRLANLQRSLGLEQTSDQSSIEAPHLARIEGRSTSDYAEPRPPDPRIHRPGAISSGPISPGEHPSPQYSKFLGLQDESEQGSWTLDGFTIQASQVLVLFKHFDKVLWRHMPILERCTSFAAFYSDNELLFWTIILVSARLYNEYDIEVFLPMIPRHRNLLSTFMFSQRMSLKTIHAMILICTWPYPVSSQYDDLTWMLCGAAINMAMIMGLHKPSHTHEYGHEYERIPGPAYIRHITWLALFSTATSVGSWLGMPPPLCTASHFETIDNLCRDERLPKSFRASASIQRQVAQFSTALDSKIDFRTRFSLIKMYESEIDRVQTVFQDAWSDELEIDYLAAKIFLAGFAFISSNVSSTSQHDSETRAIGAREMLQHGLSAASRLLSTISNTCLPHTSRGENKTGCSDYIYQLSFYPKHFFRIGAFANFYLLWFLAVDAQASEADKELAKTWVTFTYRLLGAFKHSSEHLRAAKGIELMSRLRPSVEGTGAESNELVVNSRLGASIMYSYHFRDCSRLVVENKKLVDLPLLGIDSIGNYPEPLNKNEMGMGMGKLAVSDTGRIEEVDSTSPDSDRGNENRREHMIRLDDLSIAYGRDTASVSSPDGMNPPHAALNAKGTPQSQTSSSQGTGGGGGKGQGLPPGQLPLPEGNFNNLFSNAFFQDSHNQDFDFVWQEWDPAVFDDLKMDVDGGVVGGGDAGNMKSEQ